MSNSIAERHQYILNKLHEQGYVNVSDLGHELSVSVVTIRKDLKILEDRQLLFRTHGSATPGNPYVNNRPVDEKEKICVQQKQQIAQKAISLIKTGDSIILASGSTILELAKFILNRQSENLTVVTASANVAALLNKLEGIEIWQLGGVMRKGSVSVVGPIAEKMLEGFSCNLLFMGADGIDVSFGITTTNALEASLNQRMMKSAQKIILLADSSKFGRRGFGKICDLSQLDLIITDRGMPDGLYDQIESLGVEVIRV